MKLSPVPRVDAGSLRDFQAQVAAHGMPAVVTGCDDRSGMRTTWTLAALAARFGSVKIPVRDSHDEYRVFCGGADGLRPRKMMTVADYIRLIEGCESSTDDLPYAGNISIRDDPAVADKLVSLLDECQFPDWLPGSTRDEHRLWIGGVGQRSTIHNDPYDNFNAQIIGTKRFLLYAPDQHDGLYPKFHHAAMWASPIDPDAPDLAQYPRFADVSGYECELQAGEILFIPRFWWHAVQTRKVSVNVNRWVYFDEGRWHQQPQARRFISYRKLLAQVVEEFDSLPSFLREFRREEFEKLRGDLEELMVSESDAQQESASSHV